MKRFGIFTNKTKDCDRVITNRLICDLEKQGAEVFEENIPEDVDCILVLGGDGTVLKAARDYPDIPLVGVNLGTLGYLTEIEPVSLDGALRALVEDKGYIEERMMLQGEVIRGEYHKNLHQENAVNKEQELGKVLSLNDIVITRCGNLHIVNLEVAVNQRPLTTYKADGVILATPTGSTGYSLSAGGPIVEPKAKLIMMTPICSHDYSSRGIILSETDVVDVKIPLGHDGQVQSLEVTFDGIEGLLLYTGDVVRIKKADKTMKLYKLSSESFLSTLQRKLSR